MLKYAGWQIGKYFHNLSFTLPGPDHGPSLEAGDQERNPQMRPEANKYNLTPQMILLSGQRNSTSFRARVGDLLFGKTKS